MVGTARPMSTQPGGAGCRCARQVEVGARCAAAARGRVMRRAPRTSRERVRIEHRVGGDVVGARGVLGQRREPVGRRRCRRRARTARTSRSGSGSTGSGPARAARRAANGPANRRRISGPASRLKISPGRRRTIAQCRGPRAPSSMSLALRPCGARRRATATPSRGHDSSTARSFGPGEYTPTEEAWTSASTPAATAASNTRRDPSHVHALQLRVVAARLDQPREVDDGVGAARTPDQVVARDVGRHPAHLRRVPVGQPARDPDDLPHALVLAQRPHDTRPDVAGRSGDHDFRMLIRRALPKPG